MAFDDTINLLLQAAGQDLAAGTPNPTGTLSVLMSETLKFRDKLKAETGYTLTVEDTRVALDALEARLHDSQQNRELTDEQSALVQIWFDRLTLFRRS